MMQLSALAASLNNALRVATVRPPGWFRNVLTGVFENAEIAHEFLHLRQLFDDAHHLRANHQTISQKGI